MHQDVVILPSFALVEDWRKRYARNNREGLFSQTVTTFNAWVADLWELHGDGRAIVDSLQRQTIMQAAFDDGACVDGSRVQAQDALTVSQGVVKLAAQCVRAAAGVPEFEHAVAEAAQGSVPGALSAREAVLLQGIGRYYTLLEQAGLVEIGQAAACLSAWCSDVFPDGAHVLVAEAAPLDWHMQSFFAACENVALQVEQAPGALGVDRVPAHVKLRFGFPSGRYAQPALVSDLVRAVSSGCVSLPGNSADIVVACKDPLALYKQIEHAIAKAGAVGCVQAQVPFSSTDFGRQFLSLGLVLDEEDFEKECLSDAARPPFSGFDNRDALQIDRELRANRLARKDECLASLRSASDTFSQVEEVARDPEADILLGVFEQIAFTSPGRSDAWRAEQLAALSAVRSCAEAARAVGATMQACMRVLEDVVVTVSYESTSTGAQADAGARRVVVTTQPVAAQMGAGSCGTVVLCDLTSDDYPVADKDDAASTLFAKLGLCPPDTELSRARRTFAALQALPVEQFVCVRPLNDWDGNPTYPAALLQELIDAYRADPTDQDDLDDVYGLPRQFLEDVVQRGEEALFANALASEAASEQPVACEVPLGSPGDMQIGSAASVALERNLPDGRGSIGFCPSPSQVEAYLECPYKWFVQRRIGVEGLDEGFSALERGSFAHAVLQKFYQEFMGAGKSKVDVDGLAEAKELMRRIADEEEFVQRALEPGSGRYVASNQIEQRELEACKEQLVSYLDFEARFLPTFHPAYLEYEIGPQDGVTYAGKPFLGIVDRIDVDDAGNAVVIDYKGSIGPAYEIAGKGPLVPGKVQTRMYARAVERALGLRVVGALYVSYGKSHGCAGAFDARALEAPHLPYMRVDRCSCAAASPDDGCEVDDYSLLTFAEMLDSTETLVESAIQAMQGGNVHPMPVTAEACTYCPADHCPKRGA